MELRPKSVVIDYSTVSVTATNYVFAADTCYYISGSVSLFGTNVWEGDTVLKFASNASVTVVPSSSKAIFKTGQYRPAVFTAKDDDSISESISGSTGNPVGYYAYQALCVPMISWQLANARFMYASQGVYLGASTLTCSNVQFVKCRIGINAGGSTAYIRNTLFANTATNLQLSSSAVIAENATFAGSQYLAVFTGGSLNLTNCILANVTNLANTTNQIALYWDHNGF